MSFKNLPNSSNILDKNNFINSHISDGYSMASLGFIPGKLVTAVIRDSSGNQWMTRGGIDSAFLHDISILRPNTEVQTSPGSGDIVFRSVLGQILSIKLTTTLSTDVAVPFNLVFDGVENIWVMGIINGNNAIWKINKTTKISTLILNTGIAFDNSNTDNGKASVGGLIEYDPDNDNIWIAYYNGTNGVLKKISVGSSTVTATINLAASQLPQALQYVSATDFIWLSIKAMDQAIIPADNIYAIRLNTGSDTIDITGPMLSPSIQYFNVMNSYGDANIGLFFSTNMSSVWKIKLNTGEFLTEHLIIADPAISTTATHSAGAGEIVTEIGAMGVLTGTIVCCCTNIPSYQLYVVLKDMISGTCFIQSFDALGTSAKAISRVEIPSATLPRKIAAGVFISNPCCVCNICPCCTSGKDPGTLLIPLPTRDQVLELVVSTDGSTRSIMHNYASLIGYIPHTIPRAEMIIYSNNSIPLQTFGGNSANNPSTVRSFEFRHFPEKIFNLTRRVRLNVVAQGTLNNTGFIRIRLFDVTIGNVSKVDVEINNNSGTNGIQFGPAEYFWDVAVDEDINGILSNNSNSIISGRLYQLGIGISGNAAGEGTKSTLVFSVKLVVDYA